MIEITGQLSEDGSFLVILKYHLDVYGASTLKKATFRVPGKEEATSIDEIITQFDVVTLDLSQVMLLDTTGIGVLLMLAQKRHDAGKPKIRIDPNSEVILKLETANANNFFEFVLDDN